MNFNDHCFSLFSHCLNILESAISPNILIIFLNVIVDGSRWLYHNFSRFYRSTFFTDWLIVTGGVKTSHYIYRQLCYIFTSKFRPGKNNFKNSILLPHQFQTALLLIISWGGYKQVSVANYIICNICCYFTMICVKRILGYVNNGSRSSAGARDLNQYNDCFPGVKGVPIIKISWTFSCLLKDFRT